MAETITKEALAAAVQNTGVVKHREAAKQAVDAVVDCIKAAVRSGATVRLKSFGSFAVTDVPEKPGRNPQTGAAMTIAAHQRVKFKAATGLLA